MSGNAWMFSDQIDDEDLEFIQHEYVTYNMASEYYVLGLKPVTRLAHESGAIYKMQKNEGITEALKRQDAMLWVRSINSIRSRAEEIVLNEIMYR